MSHLRLPVGSTAAVGACLLPPGAEAAFGPAAQFSSTENPAGPWSYGWSVSLGSTFKGSPTRGARAGRSGLRSVPA